MNPSGFYVDPKSPLKYAVEQSITKSVYTQKKASESFD